MPKLGRWTIWRFHPYQYYITNPCKIFIWFQGELLTVVPVWITKLLCHNICPSVLASSSDKKTINSLQHPNESPLRDISAVTKLFVIDMGGKSWKVSVICLKPVTWILISCLNQPVEAVQPRFTAEHLLTNTKLKSIRLTRLTWPSSVQYSTTRSLWWTRIT